MSGGDACNCPERKKPLHERLWRVNQHRCHHSAFNGYKHTPSAYSSVYCQSCRCCWRTKAAYADVLPRGRSGS